MVKSEDIGEKIEIMLVEWPEYLKQPSLQDLSGREDEGRGACSTRRSSYLA